MPFAPLHMTESSFISAPASVLADQFADVRILRFQVPGFEQFSLQKKCYIYHLSEAALWGRDILWDQYYRHNLWVRRILETCLDHNTTHAHYAQLRIYVKQIWFANGIHHAYSTDKLIPPFTAEILREFLEAVSGLEWISVAGQPRETWEAQLVEILYGPNDSKRVCHDESVDLLTHSACNFYQHVTRADAEAYYARLPHEPMQPQPGLNTTLVHTGGALAEKTWALHGLYGPYIEQIVAQLTLASRYAENQAQRDLIEALIAYYHSGDLVAFDQYQMLWIKEQQGEVDFINGFIEVYADPLGRKATWESMVQTIDSEATQKAATISAHAQWFEDHAPVNPRFRKKTVAGVSMRVVHAAMLGGDCYPASPLGINLPNADYLREHYGSKSISIQNIAHAHHQASLAGGVVDEFTLTSDEKELHARFGALADALHTHLHECLGHGSGAMAEGITLEHLKSYASVIEEARADLYALYFMADPYMQELGWIADSRIWKTHYQTYLRNGLITQLARVEPHKHVEQTHMRSRKLIGEWIMKQSVHHPLAAWVTENHKQYLQIIDFEALRLAFGELLAEIQRIKSTGDHAAAHELVETLGIRINPELHAEVRERYTKLGIAPFTGFVNPRLTPVYQESVLTDIQIDYSESYEAQMRRYGNCYRAKALEHDS